MRYRKHVERLEEAIKNEPESLDVHGLNLPPCIADNDSLKHRVLERLAKAAADARRKWQQQQQQQ